ncbi:hypothetical protein PIB30_086538 [Stylosanthes scabra]|uniref:Uncharacterized protein n=1 Tax=Stylosanthes scabra TaxID=79078 RepID=A0ABU6TTV5_9FABA|nr:hypothetical protein [Stylosanthes scabra]
MAMIAQGLQSKGNLGFPSTIYKLCKDAGVPLREFRRTSKIPEENHIMRANTMKTSKAMKNTSPTLVNNKRLEIEKNLQQAVERQGRDIAEMRKQLTFWTRNASAREAYTFWAHQQANPNLSQIPINQIPDLMQTNAEKGRPMFYGCLKSDYGASSSSQADPQEPVPLRTAPPIPSFQPPYPPPN